MRRVRLEQTQRGGTLWIWYRVLDRHNGYLAWGPIGTPFNRRRPLHWLVALFSLWRDGRRPK